MVLKTLITSLTHGSGTAFPGTEKVKENSHGSSKINHVLWTTTLVVRTYVHTCTHLHTCAHKHTREARHRGGKREGERKGEDTSEKYQVSEEEITEDAADLNMAIRDY